MARSVSEQDELNSALAKKACLRISGLLKITHWVPQENCVLFFHRVNPLLTKLIQSRWLDIGLIPFLHVYEPWLHLGL